MIFPYSKLITDLQLLINNDLSDNTICLGIGHNTPALTDDTFTYLGQEANFGGYARQAAVTWSAAVLNSDSLAFTSGPNYLWVANGSNLPQTITLVFAIDSSGALAWAELLPSGPVTLTNAGDAVLYQPQVTLGEVGLV